MCRVVLLIPGARHARLVADKSLASSQHPHPTRPTRQISSRRCHEDATRELLPWNFSYDSPPSTVSSVTVFSRVFQFEPRGVTDLDYFNCPPSDRLARALSAWISRPQVTLTNTIIHSVNGPLRSFAWSIYLLPKLFFFSAQTTGDRRHGRPTHENGGTLKWRESSERHCIAYAMKDDLLSLRTVTIIQRRQQCEQLFCNVAA